MMQYKTWVAAGLIPLATIAMMSCSKNDGSGGDSSTAKVQLSGKLSNVAVSGVRPYGTGNVTHIMAVSAGTADAQRVISTVDGSGNFVLDVDGAKPWILVFLDSTKVGKNMILGMYKASSADLDSLAPKKTEGAVNLGTVSVNGTTSVASASIPFADLLTALGISSATATTLGALDNICLRYVNPDIDGNGTIDALETKNFMLDFHIRYNIYKNGANAKVTDLLNAHLPSNNTTLNYSSTGVAVAYPSTFSTSTSGTVIFEQDFDPGTGNVVAGNPVTAAYPLSWGNTRGFYANTSSSTLPSGIIRFTVDSTKEMSFTNVTVPSSAELTTPEGRFVPFIKVNTTDPACTSACSISSLEYKWMKKADAGNWVDATLEELALIVSDSGGYFNFRRRMDNDRNIGFKIPQTSLSGTVTWAKANFDVGSTTDAEFAATTTAMICNIGLSYDDKLGMRYFVQIAEEAGADCPP